jgi:hypothetical protein
MKKGGEKVTRRRNTKGEKRTVNKRKKEKIKG